MQRIVLLWHRSRDRGCPVGVARGADPSLTPPTPFRLMLPMATLMSPSPVRLRGGEGVDGKMPRSAETPVAVLQAPLA